MTVLAAAVGVLVFVAALEALGVVRQAAMAAASSRSAAGLIRDTSLTDEEKERAMRAASISLFGRFLSIVARSAGAFLLSLVPILAFTALGVTSFGDVSDWLVTIQGIVAVSMLVGLWILARRLR